MKLKRLIKDQTLTIDDHKRGAGEVMDWDAPGVDVLIDKSTNYLVDGKHQKVRIRIPINTELPIVLENGSGESIDDIPETLQKEIKEALEDRDIRNSFVTDLVEILKNLDTLLSSEESARDILENFSSHFGREWSKFKATTYSKDILHYYSETYFDEVGTEYFINVNRFEIRIGQGRLYPFGPLVPKK